MDTTIINKLWNEAKPRTMGLPYIEPGVYDLEITVCKLVESSKTAGEAYFITEFKILKSSNPKFNPDDVVCVMGNMRHSPVVADTKTFIAECTQSPFDKVTPDVLANVVHPEKNKLKGTVVNCVAEDMPSKKTGKLYTRHRWRLVSISPGLKKVA